jgi:hypothetical protein
VSSPANPARVVCVPTSITSAFISSDTKVSKEKYVDNLKNLLHIIFSKKRNAKQTVEKKIYPHLHHTLRTNVKSKRVMNERRRTSQLFKLGQKELTLFWFVIRDENS